MDHRRAHETKTTNPLSWNPSYSANIASTGDDEVAADVDEPPDLNKSHPMPTFQRTEIKGICPTSSLLTQAIQSEIKEQGYCEDDEDDGDDADDAEDDGPKPVLKFVPQARRRSMASNISVATTAELTSDTGMTSPSRACTPSPPHYGMGILRIPLQLGFEPEIRPILSPPSSHSAAPLDLKRTDATPKAEAPKKRCISFACGNPPSAQPARTTTAAAAPPLARPPPLVKSPSAEGAPRKTCIKFACPARPSSTHNTPPRKEDEADMDGTATIKIELPSTPKTSSVLGLRGLPSPRPLLPRRQSKSPAPPRRPNFLRANPNDLASDASHFHEFASNESRVDDWIRQEMCAAGKKKITIDDTLVKENTIRRLAREAEDEEEAELDEEDEDEERAEDENDDNDGDDDDDDEDDEDDEDQGTVQDDDDDENARKSMYHDRYDVDSDDMTEFSDGYRTDEETGFADSDDESEDDQDLFWTPGAGVVIPPGTILSNYRRCSIAEQLSDASTSAGSWRPPARRFMYLGPPLLASDLPDSTDFVCGTFDEDRPLEEAYMSALEARQREKLHIIPQDIDPSFPMSDPEDEDEDGDGRNHGARDKKKHSSHDDDSHAKGTDEAEGRGRRHKKDHHISPRRYHSPPPKRKMHSPPPKRMASPPPPARVRGRSPCPRRARSPAPCPTVHFVSPPPAHATNCFNIEMAKSLPKPTGMLHQIRNGRRRPTTGAHAAHHNASSDVHVRGAIDIVKGLEQKRKRRREKFLKNYCDRARKGQLPERKALPAGLGAEKMKEIGLLMAAKRDQGNFVLSI